MLTGRSKIICDKLRCDRMAAIIANIQRLGAENGYSTRYSDLAALCTSRGLKMSSSYVTLTPKQHDRYIKHLERHPGINYQTSGLFSIEIIMVLCDAYQIPLYKVFEGVE